MDYAPFILSAIVRPLKEEGLDGVAKALEIMREYRISREDIESLVELSSWPGVKNPLDAVESKVKAALTRAYNKEALAFVPATKKKSKAEDEEMLADIDGDGQSGGEDDDEDDNMDNDTMIKQKKKTVASTDSGKAKSKEKKEKEPKAKKAPSKKKWANQIMFE